MGRSAGGGPSWTLVGVLFWPLIVVGVLLKEDVARCADCGEVLGRGQMTVW
jgi:hypothetical protein